MVEYASLKKKHTGTAMAAVSLALCVVLSASMLFSRLTAWLPSDPQHYIPLTVSNGLTTVVSGQRTDTGDARFRSLPGQPVLLAASPFLSESWFQVFDENTVWSGETDIEIFRLSYENGDGQVTVNSNTGHKLLAPGTSNTYAFTLENTGNHAVSYEMSMEAFFSDGEKVIPVQARVYDAYGVFYAGTRESSVEVMELNGVSDSGTLKSGYVMPYILEWEWPYESGDDGYDTWLGNQAVAEDITLTIVINTLASYTADPPVSDGENPKTGDSMGPAMLALAASSTGLVVLLLLSRRKEEHHG